MATRIKQSNRLGAALLKLAGLAVLAFMAIGYAGESQARLDPFYIVRNQSFGDVRPRILFLLDNSGSMGMDETYKPLDTYPNTKCWWLNCEDDDAGFLQSRIHASRRVIRNIINQNEGKADFAVMTFGTISPPASAAEVPTPCVDTNTLEQRRFTWIVTSNQPYSTQWKPVYNGFGGQGFWALCGDNRPFPYLRHDDLGGFSMANNSAEPLLDQPLYVSKSDLASYQSAANYTRKVQFFPRFIGRRANLDCSDPNQEVIVLNSWGDWANTDADRSTEVCGHDYYYWPYVDGNPGYSYYDGKTTDPFSHQECNDDASCSIKTDDRHRLGVTRRVQATGGDLYAPFYSQEAVDDPGITGLDKGPYSKDDAKLILNGVTDKQYAGGIDIAAGTPIAASVGEPEDFVFVDGNNEVIGYKPAVPKSNAAFTHESAASYIAFLRSVDANHLCRPVSLIIVTDGQPDPWSSQGGTTLYTYLRSMRRVLGVKTYMVAISDGVVDNATTFERAQSIACAAAGSPDVSNPCAAVNDLDWDTCHNPADPVNDCAYLASNHEELNDALNQIINQDVESDIPGGTPTTATDFQLSDPNDPNSSQAAVQTAIGSYTRSPSWFGHVTRGSCTDEDPNNPGQLADYCQAAANLPVETEETESFGPCPISRVWDAGLCLQQTDPVNRRLYTHDFNNQRVEIANGGAPTPAFENLVLDLNSQGKIDPPLTLGNESAEIQAMVDLLVGNNLPEGWKLPGLSNAAPILIRRVPKQDSNFLPSVGIRDPHCSGRRNVLGDNVPDTLQAFASQAWQTSSGGGFATHYDYTEAVVIGDDFGVLHAFHYDSGNELFGFLPLALINNARVLSLNGPSRFGQPDSLDAHVFGIASTINAGWSYDDVSKQWRHLAVFGLGPGGSQILAVDLAHMGRLQDDDPFDVVWTSTTAAIASDYADTLGQTWSRPALTYAVPNNQMSLAPKGYLVFGSGYRDGVGDVRRGRVLWMVDAATGETVTSKAYLPLPLAGTTYDVEDDVTAVSDIAIGSHCLSRYWGEMQEAYLADPAGRLYRWDLAADVSNVSSFAHDSDSGGTWPLDGDGFAVASEAFRFPACQGTGDFTCDINPIAANGNKGDVFTFSPAVVANNRIDDIDDPGDVPSESERDQFLVALVSGSPNDDVIDGSDELNDFHSSIYLLADDHRVDKAGGFDIPVDAPTTAPGAHPYFMRLPLNQITRTRNIVFPDNSTEAQTRPFSKKARPLRPPMIRVTGVADGVTQLDAEAYYVTYTIYEPGDAACDSRWYDQVKNEWVYDLGATYEITFRLVLSGTDPFNFQNGFTLPGDYGDGFGTGGGLQGPVVQQVSDCEDGNCGAALRAPKYSPCDPNVNAPPVNGMTSIQTGASELTGFTPLEIPL